MKLTGNIHQP